MNPAYVQTVNLLLDIAPTVFQTDRFAMKGGTALNLFVQDMPRLSVDIDVVFLNHQVDRDTALHLPVQTRSLSESTQELFSKNIQVPVLAPSELYGSKLVAAMDRQHPRDFFDVFKMYQSHGLTQEILDCFVVYLAGHNRPIHEVLFSNPQPMEETFKNEFVGMTSQPIELEALVDTQQRLMAQLPQSMTANHKNFLLSLVETTPDWSLMPFDHLQEMPAIKWKLQHLKKLRATNHAKFKFQSEELMRRFG